MFRLSRQAFKAVPRPGLRLSNGTASRQIHSVRLPYTGPPSYDTITRRLSSSQVDPQVFFTRKRQQEAKDRGEYVDIHDIGGTDPADYDVLITDINHEKLQGEIAEELGMPYLSKAAEADAKEMVEVCKGYIHGRNYRPIVPLVVSLGDEARWVFFIVDSGAPLTYLSDEASKLFRIAEGVPTPVKIGGYRQITFMSPSNSHFHELNLLGGDYCRQNDVRVWDDYVDRRVTLHFGGKWEVIKKS